MRKRRYPVQIVFFICSSRLLFVRSCRSSLFIHFALPFRTVEWWILFARCRASTSVYRCIIIIMKFPHSFFIGLDARDRAQLFSQWSLERIVLIFNLNGEYDTNCIQSQRMNRTALISTRRIQLLMCRYMMMATCFAQPETLCYMHEW